MSVRVNVKEEFYTDLQEIARIWSERMSSKLKEQFTSDDVFDMFMTAVMYLDRVEETLQ